MANVIIKCEEHMAKVRAFESTLPEKERNLDELIQRFTEGFKNPICEIYSGWATGKYSFDFTLKRTDGTTFMNGGWVYFEGDGWSSHT